MTFMPQSSLGSSHTGQVPEGKGRDWENDELACLGKDQVQNHLRNLKPYKSMGPDERYLQVLRQEVDVVEVHEVQQR